MRFRASSPPQSEAIAPKTLREAFRAELDRGMALANYAVTKALYVNATEHNNVTAQIWWTKARLGWKQTTQQQYLDEHGNPTAPSGPVINYYVRTEPAAKTAGGEVDGFNEYTA